MNSTTMQPEVKQLLASLSEAIDRDRRFFVAAKTDPVFEPVRAHVDALLDELAAKARKRAQNDIASAQKRLNDMEGWHPIAAAPANYNQARTAMGEAEQAFETAGYFGYLDVIPLAQTARAEAESAVRAQKSAMRKRMDKLEEHARYLRREIEVGMRLYYNPTAWEVALDLYQQAQEYSRVETYESYVQAESALKECIEGLEILYNSVQGALRAEQRVLRAEKDAARRALDRAAQKSELLKLHLALGLLLLSVAMPVGSLAAGISLGAFPESDPIMGLVIVGLYLPALPLALADSIWNLGKKEPATEFSTGYLWLLLLNILGSLVSLVWIFASYPASLKAINERYPDV